MNNAVKEYKDYMANRPATGMWHSELEPFAHKLCAEVERLEAELSAIQHAAHMPEDYKHGLPTWINHLWGCYIGSSMSPLVLEEINKGTLTFPQSPANKKVVQLTELNRQLLEAIKALVKHEKDDMGDCRMAADGCKIHAHDERGNCIVLNAEMAIANAEANK